MKEILIVLSLATSVACGPKKKEKTIIVQGEQGEPGVEGKRGDTGKDGKDGVGIQGQSGRDGRPGDRGEMGPRGNDGSNGQNGNHGRDGVDGQNGNHGRDGTDGEVLIYPTPKYSRYCYDYYDVTTLDECQGQISSRYHIFYRVYSMPNGDVFSDLCEGYGATSNNCANGLRTTKTYTLGDPDYSTAWVKSKYLTVKLLEPLKAEIKAKDFTHTVTCNAIPPKG